MGAWHRLAESHEIPHEIGAQSRRTEKCEQDVRFNRVVVVVGEERLRHVHGEPLKGGVQRVAPDREQMRRTEFHECHSIHQKLTRGFHHVCLQAQKGGDYQWTRS